MKSDNTNQIEMLNSNLNELSAEVEFMDKLKDDNSITLQAEGWDSGEAIYLTKDDVQVLIDRRVEEMNELEHELRALED